ncbi:MAG: tetratricopeptide repeat protein [Alphaproteobacteria bacterium]|nr:tetratricopeptide repeat protein [Alphaproteobacteria bacterium]
MTRPLLWIALAGLSLGTVGCKKKPPVTPPVETPAPAPVETDDGSAGVDEPEPEPAPAPAPAPRAPKADDPEAVRKKVNNLLDGVDSTDVAKNRATLDALKALRGEHPELPEIDVNIGVIEQKLGNASGAKTAYEAALAKDPTLGEAYLYLGALKEEAGDLTGAEAKYREGLTRAPESVAVRIGLVSTLRKQGRYDEAIAAAQDALKVNSTSPEIYNDVGLAYLAQKDFLLAKFMFRKGLALPQGEEKAYLHANLGWTYYLEDKIPEATFRLKKAVELDPEYVPGLVYLARVYMEDRNYQDTVDLLERAAQRSPENHGVQMNLGIAYRGVERYEDSKKAYERALTLDPSNPAPHFNLGILYGDYVKDYDASIAAFNTYKSAGGTDIARADEYIDAVDREKKRVEKRNAREAAAKKKDAERAEQKRLAAEEAERQRLEEERQRQEAEKAGVAPQPAPEEGTVEEGTEEPVDVEPVEEEPVEEPVEEEPVEEEPVEDVPDETPQ